MADKVEVVISLNEELVKALPDILRIMRAGDTNGYLEDILPMKSNGTLQRMAEERYDRLRDPKFGREAGTAMIASGLLDEAIHAIVAATIKGTVK